MRPMVVVLMLGLLGCTPSVGSPCRTECDCAGGITNVKCPGNFSCRSGACAYDCAQPCTGDGGVNECPAGQACAGDAFCTSTTRCR
ncbi:MAG: hypothetical protein JNM69_17490 [Archangium sp.]|nr:hypothetical protein [Archangium sp.]